ncbi:hypothetical protein NDU88_003869 [Pleurodeles waltl]|uniref:Uncharacterized protein n=1 Tax=Pleurodeles waltl TaxID=8319 RepID=A0AAV7NHZ7_PLEWA|nr:hypothetical protein NDU88_003869 [Pleurodeles waltl]
MRVAPRNPKRTLQKFKNLLSLSQDRTFGEPRPSWDVVAIQRLFTRFRVLRASRVSRAVCGSCTSLGLLLVLARRLRGFGVCKTAASDSLDSCVRPSSLFSVTRTRKSGVYFTDAGAPVVMATSNADLTAARVAPLRFRRRGCSQPATPLMYEVRTQTLLQVKVSN